MSSRRGRRTGPTAKWPLNVLWFFATPETGRCASEAVLVPDGNVCAPAATGTISADAHTATTTATNFCMDMVPPLERWVYEPFVPAVSSRCSYQAMQLVITANRAASPAATGTLADRTLPWANLPAHYTRLDADMCRCVWHLTVSIRQKVFNPKVTRLLADKQLNRYSGRPGRPRLGGCGRASSAGDAGGLRPCVEASPAGDAGVCGPASKRHPLVTPASAALRLSVTRW